MYEAVIWIHQIWNSFQRLVIVNTGNEWYVSMKDGGIYYLRNYQLLKNYAS
jgi:hypothetical protein